MRSKLIAAARVSAVISGLAVASIVGSGVASAGPQDCAVAHDPFSASVTCHDTGAPPGREYYLSIECWGLHGIPNAFPFYAVGPYNASTSSFGPTGQASGTCSSGWGAIVPNVGVVTGAHVETYVQ